MNRTPLAANKALGKAGRWRKVGGVSHRFRRVGGRAVRAR